MDINVLWLAGPNNTEKFTKNRNHLCGLMHLVPSVHTYTTYTACHAGAKPS